MSIGNGALMIALMKKMTTLGADVVLDMGRCGVMYQFDGKGDVKCRDGRIEDYTLFLLLM